MSYTPSQTILEKYAQVLINYALGGGTGIRPGEVVRVIGAESNKPLYVECLKAVWKAGGHVIEEYMLDDPQYELNRTYYELASDEQLEHFNENYYRGLADDVDHQVVIISETDKHELEGIDPKKMMLKGQAMKRFMDWRNEKESAGKFTWTLGLYGTPQMAAEVGMTQEEYWDEIIKACFLDEDDPVSKWREVVEQIESYRAKLNDLPIDVLHIKGEDADLRITLGEKRAWMGGSGRNIPSFEIFTSPDWRGTNGWIRFNQPLYRYGNLIEGIRLEFKDGEVSLATATKNQQLLQQMIETEGANKIGEFSLTDARFSRIEKFMGETLYDENVGGRYGNTHIAVGASYHDCYAGDPSKVTKDEWEQLGYNDSSVHTDVVSTTDRTVTATLKDGSERVIYRDGQFVL